MSTPSQPDALLQRALSFHRAGRIDRALPIYRQLTARFAGNRQLLFLLGSAECQGGNTAEGVRLLEQCLLADPMNANAYNNLGLGLEKLERHDEALESYDRAIALQPRSSEAYINRGLVLRRLHRFEEALECFERALAIDRDDPELHKNRGNVLVDLRRPEEALAALDRAIELRPDHAEAFANRAGALQAMRRYPEALASLERAISLDPSLAEAHNQVAELLTTARRLVEARKSFERAHALNPGLDLVLSRLLFTKLRICDWTQIESQLRKLELHIARGEELCLPFDSLGLTGSAEAQRKAAQAYAQARLPRDSSLGPILWQARHPRIRVAYYSSEFRDHATMRLMAELFEVHDRNRFELIGMDFGPVADDPMRRRVQAAFDRFIDVRKMSDRDVAQLSRQLEVDIAVDLKGYTEDSRPAIFAERAAPLQVSFLGYPGTMGVDWIDYIVADPVVIPAGSERFYTEKIAFLPDSYQVNDRARAVAERAFTRDELRLPREGFVFCCFNNNYKVMPAVFDVWMRILKRVGDSVLWLFEDSPAAAANLRREAEKRGVRAERLVFATRMPLPDHLARHRAADLLLDTLPYNAHTTASDALWVGLPVLTRAGEAFSSRVCASLLTALGLPELITNTATEFEALAVALAHDRPRLAAIGRKLKASLQTAPLFDTPRFARHIEALYSEMYERSIAGRAPEHIRVGLRAST